MMPDILNAKHVGLCVVLLLVVSVLPVAADTTNAAETPTRENISRFVDSEIPRLMEIHRIPGATVAVTSRNRSLYMSGYGYADIENDIKVNPWNTLFEVGSVSKPVTFTAVMKKVDNGEMNLDEDVESYLEDTDVELHEVNGTSVKLWHLGTHTAGFEDVYRGLYTYDEAQHPMLEEVIVEAQPQQIREPGKLAAYSNWGMALTGYILTRESDKRFPGYMKDELLEPLGMLNSTYKQPVPSDLRNSLAKGYRYRDGEYKESRFGYIALEPAGSLRASGADMAKFMRLHLRNGSLSNRQFISKESMEEMHSQRFTHHPELNGLTPGFIEKEINQKELIWHSGMTENFFTQIALIPGEDIGVFVSFNSEGGSTAGSVFIREFMDEFYPENHRNTIDAHGLPKSRANTIKGEYRSTRTHYSSWMKITSPLLSLHLDVDENGSLVTSNPAPPPFGLGSDTWREVEPWVFVNSDGTNKLIIDTSGKRNRVYIDSQPMWAYEELGLHEETRTHAFLFIFSIIVFSGNLIYLALSIAMNRELDLDTSKLIGGFNAFLLLIFIAGFAWVLRDPVAVYAEGSYALTIALMAPYLFAASCIGLVVAVVRSQIQGWTGYGTLLHHSLLVLGSIIVTSQFVYWRFLPI